MAELVLFAQESASSTGASSLAAALITPAGRAVAAVLLAAVGVFLLLPPRGKKTWQFATGASLTALAVMILLVPSLVGLPAQFAFWLLEALAILGALGTIASRSPVYSAIWFASALLAIGALLLLAGAQFLGLATVAVYAGAIVVTFLFVLMLAQPRGRAVHDRLGWGALPTFSACLAGASFAGLIAASAVPASSEMDATDADTLRGAVVQAIASVAIPDDEPTTDEAASMLRRVRLTNDVNQNPVLYVDLASGTPPSKLGDAALAAAIRGRAGEQLPPSCRIEIREAGLLAANHVARLGAELFARHLISIQVVGVLLLAALVGAIAMAIHGKDLQAGFERPTL